MDQQVEVEVIAIADEKTRLALLAVGESFLANLTQNDVSRLHGKARQLKFKISSKQERKPLVRRITRIA